MISSPRCISSFPPATRSGRDRVRDYGSVCCDSAFYGLCNGSMGAGGEGNEEVTFFLTCAPHVSSGEEEEGGAGVIIALDDLGY